MLQHILLLIAALPLAAPAQAPKRDPILFVHGWRGAGAQWNTMAARFRQDGWRDTELFAWTIDARESNAAAAARIAARVDQILVATGAERVDIVTHSMGALSARYYLRNLRSAGKVDAWVSLGGPNHGIFAAGLCFSAACREMRRGSPFLAALNQGDETPGTARYATWRSPCDEIIDPPETVVLDGAANHQTGCISHLELLRDTAVYRAVRDFVSNNGAHTEAQRHGDEETSVYPCLCAITHFRPPGTRNYLPYSLRTSASGQNPSARRVPTRNREPAAPPGHLASDV